MDVALEAFGGLVDYEIAEVTAAATFYIAEVYLEFSHATAAVRNAPPASVLPSWPTTKWSSRKRPTRSKSRRSKCTKRTSRLLTGGIYNPWVQQSLDKLVTLMPGTLRAH